MRSNIKQVAFVTTLFLLTGCHSIQDSMNRIKISNEDLTVYLDNQPVFTYNIAEDLPTGVPNHYMRSGYIHPLYSPGGKVITDGFPEGHVHQHGIFLAFPNTAFRGDTIDFWNQHKKLATVRHQKILKEEIERDTVNLSVLLEHVSFAHGVILEEIWNLTIWKDDLCFVIDFFSSIENITTDTFHVLPYPYGGLAVRGSAQWNEDDTIHYQSNAEFRTMDIEDKESANHQNTDWAVLYGLIDNEAAGIALIDHRENIKHPQKVRIHPKMPYFCYVPTVDGGFTIYPKENFQARYRILSFDGIPDLIKINQIANHFNLN